MRRGCLGVVLFVALLTVLVVGVSTVYVYRNYVVDLKEVDQILAALPPSEAEPPEEFLGLVKRLHPYGFAFFPVRNLISEIHPEPSGIPQWQLRYFVWGRLLPRRLSEGQMLALYAHYMPYEGGRGLLNGARYYYNRAPSELSSRELLELLVIAKSPSTYSPTKNPDRLKEEVERLSMHPLGPST